jgi:hypothetical protein
VQSALLVTGLKDDTHGREYREVGGKTVIFQSCFNLFVSSYVAISSIPSQVLEITNVDQCKIQVHAKYHMYAFSDVKLELPILIYTIKYPKMK